MARLPSSYFTALGLIVATAIIWLVVVGIWIVEKEAPTRYLFPPGNDSSVSGYVIAGFILWLLLELSFLADAAVVLLIGTHSLRVTRNVPKEGLVYDEDEDEMMSNAQLIERNQGRTKGARRVEMAITIVAGIIIIGASIYLLALYSAMLSRCDKYEFCCGICNRVNPGDNDGDEAAGGCANVRGDFLAQYIFVLIGVIMSIIVSIWSMIIATTPSEADKARQKRAENAKLKKRPDAANSSERNPLVSTGPQGDMFFED